MFRHRGRGFAALESRAIVKHQRKRSNAGEDGWAYQVKLNTALVCSNINPCLGIPTGLANNPQLKIDWAATGFEQSVRFHIIVGTERVVLPPLALLGLELGSEVRDLQGGVDGELP